MILEIAHIYIEAPAEPFPSSRFHTSGYQNKVKSSS